MTASALSPLRAASAGTGRDDPGQRPRGHPRPRRRWPQAPLALAVSIAVTAAGTGACGAGRNILGTNTSPCFLALPVAKRAVEGRGSLAGVRMVDISKLTGASGDRALRALLDLMTGPLPRNVCLVAYTGSFTLGQVEQPAGLPLPGDGGVGRYAIAVVTTPKALLLGTFVVRRLPVDFTHARVGL
jgi:hypothetical protein